MTFAMGRVPHAGPQQATSSYKFRQFSINTAVSIGKTARTFLRLQSQLDFLATMVLQNCQALHLLTAGQRGT